MCVNESTFTPFRRFLLIGVLLTIFLIKGVYVQAQLVTTADKTFHQLAETAVTSNSMLIQFLGADPGNVLSFSGVFSDSSWSLTMTGNYVGHAVNLSFLGSFDAITNQGAYTSTGTVGADIWSAMGSYQLTDTSPDSFGTVWNSETILGAKKGDRHITDKSTIFTEDSEFKYNADTGTWIITDQNGNDTGQREKESSFSKVRKMSPKKGTEHITVGISLFDASTDFDLGEASGTVTTVPEPSTLIFLAAGILGLLGCRWRWKKQTA